MRVPVGRDNFYVRRSFDGGAAWDEPRNLSGFADTPVSAREPRLVTVPTSPNPNVVRDPNVFVAARGSEINQLDYGHRWGVVQRDCSQFRGLARAAVMH